MELLRPKIIYIPPSSPPWYQKSPSVFLTNKIRGPNGNLNESSLNISHQPSPTITPLLNLVIRISIRGILPLLNLHGIAILRTTLSALTIILVHLVDAILVVGCVVECIERLEDSALASEDPAIDPPWESLGELVVHVSAGWDGEDVVEFLKGSLLSLGDPEEDHNQRHDIRAGDH